MIMAEQSVFKSVTSKINSAVLELAGWRLGHHHGQIQAR
jgi:hypothetical protein